MPEKSCKTCGYFSLEDEEVPSGVGWCWWADDHTVPTAIYQPQYGTWASNGDECPCWKEITHHA